MVLWSHHYHIYTVEVINLCYFSIEKMDREWLSTRYSWYYSQWCCSPYSHSLGSLLSPPTSGLSLRLRACKQVFITLLSFRIYHPAKGLKFRPFCFYGTSTFAPMGYRAKRTPIIYTLFLSPGCNTVECRKLLSTHKTPYIVANVPNPRSI